MGHQGVSSPSAPHEWFPGAAATSPGITGRDARRHCLEAPELTPHLSGRVSRAMSVGDHRPPSLQCRECRPGTLTRTYSTLVELATSWETPRHRVGDGSRQREVRAGQSSSVAAPLKGCRQNQPGHVDDTPLHQCLPDHYGGVSARHRTCPGVGSRNRTPSFPVRVLNHSPRTGQDYRGGHFSRHCCSDRPRPGWSSASAWTRLSA